MECRSAVVYGALMLASCSGGGSDGGGVTVTPTGTPTGTSTPTPTPSASSSPTPAPSYTKYADLTGDRSFASTCAPLTTSSSPVVAGAATLPGQGLIMAFNSAASTWSISGDGVNLLFGPADADPATPSGGQFYLKTGTGGTDRLRIQQGGVGGVGPTEYARIVNVVTNVIGQARNYTCIIGVPTVVTDVPAATTVSYRAGFGGSGYVSSPGTGATTVYSLGKSVVSIEGNRVTGKVTLTLRLIGTPPGGGADVELGTVTGTADVDATTGGYYGTTWTSSTLTVSFGQFSGRFFGPQRLETEAVISLTADAGGPTPFTVRTVGSVIGIR